MQMVVNKSHFLKSLPSYGDFTDKRLLVGYGRFYQQLVFGLTKSIYSKQTGGEVGSEIVSIAEHAYSLRQMDTLNQVSQLLIDLPLSPQFEKIGLYYKGLCYYRQGMSDEARILFERVAEEAPLGYRARAIVSLGAVSARNNDHLSESGFYLEANRLAHSNREYHAIPIIQAQRGIAIIKSIDGNHQGALADLENLFPLLRAVAPFHPQLYYDYLNSYAVELGEAGRVEEAQSASRVALSSSFASAYPEWRETGNELALWGRHPSRSFVAFKHKPSNEGNVVTLPAPENDCGSDLKRSSSSRLQHRARIIAFPSLKKAFCETPSAAPDSETKLSGREMLLRIIELISDSNLSANQLKKILESIEAIALEK